MCQDMTHVSIFNLLSTNPTKFSNIQTIRRQQPTNYMSVFDHFVEVAEVAHAVNLLLLGKVVRIKCRAIVSKLNFALF